MIVFRTVLIILALAANQSLYAQKYNAGDKLPAEKLRNDLSILKQVLEGVHIGLYRYTPKTIVDSLFKAGFNKINEPMTEIDFFKIINPIVVAVRDEHTFALPSAAYMQNEIGQTNYSGSSSDSKAKLFPFFVKLIGNKVFIENNLSNDITLNRGDEIVSINGQPMSQVLAALLPTIATNGFSGTFRQRHLEQFSLQQTYNRFMAHYAIFIGRPDVFELGIKKPGNPVVQTVKTDALPSSAIYNFYWRRYSTVNDPKKRKEDPLGFNLIDNKTAYLRLSAFHVPVWSKYNYSYSTEFRNIFDLINKKNIQNLVIDLRGNEGGNLSIGAEVLKYICTKPYRIYNYHEVINYKFPALKKYFRDSTAFPNYPDEVFVRAGNTYRSNPQYRTEAMSRPMEIAANPFKNKVYVLVDGATGSAAAMFATAIRVNRRDAIFVGEECGGDIEGPVSGSGADITLPGSKIRVDIPFIQRVVNLEDYPHTKARGIMPDYPVSLTAKDLADGTDTQLKFLLLLIARQPTKSKR